MVKKAQLIKQAHRLADKLFTHQGELPLNLKVDRSMLQFNDLNKVMWPASPVKPALLKKHLLAYYALISPTLLPHLENRPLIIRRFPGGIHNQSEIDRYHQPIDGKPLPDYLQTVEMYSDLASQNKHFILVQNAASLLWLVNQHAVEFFPWYSRIAAGDTGRPTIFINSTGTLEMSVANYPDYMVFDLDAINPLAGQSGGEPEAIFQRNREAALYLHQYLQKHGLDSYLKTSGKNGLHLLVPIHRIFTYEQVKLVAQKIGQQLVDIHPQLFSMGWQLDSQIRVSIDSHQNSLNKAFASAFSLRATETANISTPITWKTLATMDSPQQYNLHHFFETQAAPPADLWQEQPIEPQDLSHLL